MFYDEFRFWLVDHFGYFDLLIIDFEFCLTFTRAMNIMMNLWLWIDVDFIISEIRFLVSVVIQV